MTVSANEILKKLPEKRQRKIAERAEQLHAEYLTIQDIRKARSLTQVQLAKALGINQANISQIEKRSDLLLSTLRSYIEAMGGELHLVAEFPDRPPVFLTSLAETDIETNQITPPRPEAHSA
jgi:transcriptional regulator with XRE-family HTH domain